MHQHSYHVFLSFKGKSNCRTFIDHLYRTLMHAGILTFRNDSKLEKGESIESLLQKAIQTSKISIIIFTKDYASSRRCLDEIVTILERKKTIGHKILPIFYDVDPSEVRWQKGKYGNAFARHEERFGAEVDKIKAEGPDKVQRWRAALKEVADLSGMVLEEGQESKFIQAVVEKIWNKLNHIVLSAAEHPIGIDCRMKDINLWLQDLSADVPVFMLSGIGGIGKTTIAKTAYDLYSERFESSSFLADISETIKESNGLASLQKQLLSDILKRKKEQVHIDGIIDIEKAICSRKVLIVLDDVDQVEQVHALFGTGDWFHLGSKIIITTRNEELLAAHETYAMCKVTELDFCESLQLFSWHAFGQDHPIKGYMKLSEKVIHHCQGLPLALQVLGSSLSGGGFDLWESVSKKLDNISDCSILKVLELSYELLQDDHEKNLFLDITCFFISKDKDHTIKILDECDFYTTSEIQNLVDRCLVTITRDNKLMMHQLLQEMGREIVRRESPNEPGNLSRIWLPRDAFHTVREETGTESIEGIILSLNAPKEDRLTEAVTSAERHHTEVFHNKSKCIYKEHSSKRRRLGFFSWFPIYSAMTESYPISTEEMLRTDAFSRMHKLRILQLNNIRLGGSYEKFPKKLRWLCWHGFALKSIPSDFSIESLVVLEMHKSNLEQVWQGTKLLRLLKILDLSQSHSLTKTPDFSGLPNLEKVILEDCKSLVEVHESIGSLKKLILLNLGGCGNLRKLPRKFKDLKSLENIVLIGCSKLQLYKIKYMAVHFPSTSKLFNSMGLRWCDILYSYLGTWVPKFTSSLLDLLPCSLKRLDLSECNLADDAIPPDLSIFPLLQYLDLGGNLICTIPESIKGLTALQSLTIDRCMRLQSLPELPLSLKMLDARSCRSLERMRNLPNFLRSLDLQLGDCGKLVEVLGLFKLEAIVNIDEELSKALGMVELEYIVGIEVELYNHLTYTKTKGSIQGLYEFGIFSTFLPRSEVPSWFKNKSTGSPITLNVPLLSNLKIRGFTISAIYAQHKDDYQYDGGHFIKICNKTKGLRWIYDPTFFAIPGPSEDMLWLSYWEFGNHLEGGDQMIVSLDMMYAVKEFGINLLYDEQRKESNQLDLSAYQLRTGVFLLCNHI